jgi:DNA-binding transcriptional LysR family regulator
VDRFEAMALFATIAAKGSLSAAGRELGTPLATVSRRLSELEAHLGALLIQRSTRGLALTDAGRDYLEACAQILDEVREAERVAAGAYADPRGRLVIAAPISFGRLHAVPLIVEFAERFPEVDVRLLLGDRNVNLLQEQVDVALRIGMLPDSSLVSRHIGTVSRVVCASPGYLARFGAPKSPQELDRHRCVCFEGVASPARWSFGDGGATLDVPVRTRLSVNSADAAVAGALAGLGLVRVLSYQVADELADGRLVRLLTAHEGPAIPVQLVTQGQRRLPMKCRAFIEFALPRLHQRVATVPAGAS